LANCCNSKKQYDESVYASELNSGLETEEAVPDLDEIRRRLKELQEEDPFVAPPEMIKYLEEVLDP